MRMTIYVGGGAAMLVFLALILAIPDMQAVIAGSSAGGGGPQYPIGVLAKRSGIAAERPRPGPA
jgi:hypothetical protein